MKRSIVRIDESRCNGCGQCVPNCHEGALQIIDNKARLISDLFCDGLGACVGHCPQDAITIEEREAEPYDERKVMEENIVPKGENTINAHLEHLREHDAEEYLDEAVAYLEEKGIENPLGKEGEKKEFCGCPGSRMMEFKGEGGSEKGTRASKLRQWPVQFHLISPNAPYFKKADVLLAADCTAYALGNFHKDHLNGKRLIIACPKLDSHEEIYSEKLVALVDEAEINTLTVMIMEVPCCGGLAQLTQDALAKAKRKVPVKKIVVGIRGEIISEEWI